MPVAESRHVQNIRLPDGRRLSFAEFGTPDGEPIFFFHGAGDSRLQRHHDDSIVARLGVRLITADRPGVGRSDFQPRRQLGHWAQDIASLADALHIAEFGVLGYSMGGPHALACAHGIPERLTGVGVVSGVAPLDRPGGLEGISPFAARMFRHARVSRWLVQAPLTLMARNLRRDAYGFADRLFTEAIAVDREVYSHPERRVNHVEAMLEGATQGARGLAHELAMITRPWGFDVGGMSVPVHLWYGTADATTPIQMAQYLADRIPHASLVLWPDEGHQAIFNHWEEVLRKLA